ncbi:hypothetical protein ACSSWA_14445 [Melioribacter sp. Ez-97]|uniref:hypothetical protein n=1 Tax=Melioribacter sp. Ez-97 TaxID=3423434 RepID=UPI003ED9A452
MSRIRSFFLLSLLTVVLFPGCKENNAVMPENELISKRLSKIVQNEQNYSAFYYEGSRLIKYEQIINSEIYTSREFEYGDDDKPLNELLYESGTSILKKFIYDSNGRLDKQDLYIGNNSTPYGYLKFIYDDQNRLIKKEQYLTHGSLFYYIEYDYDNADNVVEIKEFYLNKLTYRHIMQYDDKINPWHNFKDILYEASTQSKNNIINKITTSEGSSNGIGLTYTYDPDGFPLTETIFTGDGKHSLSMTYQYE